MNNRRNSRFYFLVFTSMMLLLATSSLSAFAQTDPDETAVPYPIVTPLSTSNSGYPDNAQPIPPTITLGTSTPYPVASVAPAATFTNIPIVGNDLDFNSSSPVIESEPAPSSSQLIQSNLVLWLGFLIGLLILGTGIYGAIILYMRK